MGSLGPKLLIPIGGQPALARVAATFLAHPAAGELVAVVPAELRDEAEGLLRGAPNRRGIPITVVEGGETRQDSVGRGLGALRSGLPFIAVHDVARVLVDAATIDRVLAAARERGAAIPAVPIADSVKEVSDGRVTRSVPRERLVAVQTPQIFTSDILRRAHANARAGRVLATDEASLVESIGAPIAVVEGDARNRKLTVPSDLDVLNALLRSAVALETP
jgi:2-C-methyl-D-erythritol 4-phosphate cytidylyltransferase/2-C-methyl-D-erythritol 4-phosphate cytidylyltransferase/2-C-methyl-D-erythritol 2,4-cyclodiphosphate synthase